MTYKVLDGCHAMYEQRHKNGFHMGVTGCGVGRADPWRREGRDQ